MPGLSSLVRCRLVALVPHAIDPHLQSGRPHCSRDAANANRRTARGGNRRSGMRCDAQEPRRQGSPRMADADIEDPLRQFALWFAEAEAKEPNDPSAMALATVGADGMP